MIMMCEKKDSNCNLFKNRFYDSFLNNGSQPYKKPKLDVTSSQTCATSSFYLKKTDVRTKGSTSEITKVTKLVSNDQLWGDDIDDCLINQFDIINSQALSQDISINRNLPSNPPSILSHSNKTQNVNISNGNKGTPSQLSGKAPIRSGTPLYRRASAGNVPDTPVRTSGYFSLNKSIGSPKYNAEGATIHLQSQVNKFKEECKTLREQLQSKEGEVKILRNSLTVKLSEQNKKSRNLAEKLAREREANSKKINDRDKQLKDLSTELEFKCLELKSLNKKLKQSRDHTPSSSRPSTSNTRKSLDFSKLLHSDKKHSKELGLEESLWGFNCTSFNVHEGSLLAELIEPDVYSSTVPDNSDPKTSKVSLCKEVVKPITQVSSDALSNCFLSLSMLFKCESFSTYSAKTYVKKIVIESYKSFHRHLKRMKDEGPPGELGDRSKKLFQNSHTVLPLTESYSLLCSHRLYPDERGIEVRRMLGLLELLVKVSTEAAKTVINVDFTTLDMSDHKSNNDNNNNNSKNFELNDRRHSEDMLSPCKNSVLHVLRDIILLISSERRTLQYNGVLAGAAVFLTSLVEKHLDLTEDWQLLILEIVRHILISCPGPTVILYSCQFLCAVNYYPSVIKKLCVCSVDKAEVEYDRCYTFKNDICPITVLCYIVQAMGQTKRYLVTDVMTQWFLSLLTKDNKNVLLHWLTFSPLSRSDVLKDCACPWNLSKVMTTLLCEAALVYYSDKSKIDQPEKLMLEKLLEKGLLLLYHMVQNSGFGLNLGYIEGQYELFIHTLSMSVIDLPLHPSQKKVMEVMSIQEDHKELLRRKEVNSDEELECSVFKI